MIAKNSVRHEFDGDGDFTPDQVIPVLTTGSISTGDFNADGQVDIADYTLWRDTLGATGVGLAADANGDLVVDALDYNFWKDSFGSPAASGTFESTSVVPEPGCGLLLLIVLLARFRFRDT